MTKDEHVNAIYVAMLAASMMVAGGVIVYNAQHECDDRVQTLTLPSSEGVEEMNRVIAKAMEEHALEQ